jgi:hypothetical protein
MDNGHAGLCGLGLQWLPRMFGKIRNDFGEEVLNRMLYKSSVYLMEPYVEEFVGGDEKGVISQIIRMWMYQHTAHIVPLGETDEEVAFSLTPCGSGGKLLLAGWPESIPEVFGPCCRRHSTRLAARKHGQRKSTRAFSVVARCAS